MQECRCHVHLCVLEKSVLRNRSGHDAENDRNFRKSSVSDEQVEFWRPCRGRSPGKGFAPKKAIHYMTRRAFLSSKGNTAAEEIEFQHASQKVGKVGHKNEDYSKSVSSFHSGPILPPSSAKELSRNVGVMSVYAF